MYDARSLVEVAVYNFVHALNPDLGQKERDLLIASFEEIAADPGIFAQVKDAFLAIDGWPAITLRFFPKHSRAREAAIAIIEKWPEYLRVENETGPA